MDINLFHNRHDHPGKPRLHELANYIGTKVTGTLLPCDGCDQGKAPRSPFSQKGGTPQHYRLGEAWSADAEGPFRIQTREGKKHMLTAVEHFSGLAVMFLIAKKSEQWSILKKLLVWSATQTGRKTKVFRADGEWNNKYVAAIKEDLGFDLRLTHPGTPQGNGLAEVTGGLIMRSGRILLVQARLPPNMAGHALQAACHTRNLGMGHNGIRSDAFHKRPAFRHHLRVFGCLVFIVIPKSYKIDRRARPGVFIGYGHGQHGWKAFFPASNQVVCSRDAVFREHISGMDFLRSSAAARSDIVHPTISDATPTSATGARR
jgi:hypothetical protein